jgi:hypothetical protein
MSLTSGEENRLRVFDNRALRGIFGPKRNEVRAGWRKLHIEESHILYSSPNIIKIIKTKRMGLAGNIARIGKKGMHTVFWYKSQTERDHWEDLDVSWRKYENGSERIRMVWNR